MYYFDMKDTGFCCIKSGTNEYQAGLDKVKALDLIARLNASHRPSIEIRNNSLYVCWNNHPKESDCEWELEIENCNIITTVQVGQQLIDLRNSKVVKDRITYNTLFNDLSGEKFTLTLSPIEIDYIHYCIHREQNDRLYQYLDTGINKARDNILDQISSIQRNKNGTV